MPERLRPPCARRNRLHRKSPGQVQYVSRRRFDGSRLSKCTGKHRRRRNLKELRNILPRYAKERNEGERFGDFVIRAGIVKETTDGTNFMTDEHLKTPQPIDWC
ncbi:hypothetical protein PO124_24345 [Bacillus licheniformis]|nr:hypothetical protein [Bacillus licheniformis]